MRIPIPLIKGHIRIKSSGRLRWLEEKRQIPVLVLGPLCISYWTLEAIETDRRYGY